MSLPAMHAPSKLPMKLRTGALAIACALLHTALAAAPRVLEHRAILSTAEGSPFSVVVETYTDQVLGPDAAP